MTDSELTDDVMYLLELTSWDAPDWEGAPDGAPTLALLREQIGGDRGGLTDPAGQEHYVDLSWPKLHPDTPMVIRWHRLEDDPPLGNARRYGSDPVYGPQRVCVVCGTLFSSARRARHCGPACRQRAFRLRQAAAETDTDAITVHLKQNHDLVANTVYECPTCETRLLGERRCLDCNMWCKRVGIGAGCPHCGDPVAVADLVPVNPAM